MNELQIFTNEEFGEIRTMEIDGKPYFAATDIAKALGYTSPRDAIARHCKGGVKHDTPTSSGIQNMSYINEGDVYRLIMRSKLPSAERFESWVVDEVLPSMNMQKRPIKVDLDRQTISARELYSELEVTDRFSRWFERMAAYGFVDGEDFTSVKSSTLVNNGAERALEDYSLSVDMAKHICMVQRTDKAKRVRQYLIDLEKAWNTPEQVMARALKIANATIDELRLDNEAQQERIEQMTPKARFADAVAGSKDSILVGDLAKILCQNGVEIGQKRLFQWMRDNGYLIKNGASRNIPVQKYVEMGLFEIKETTIQSPNGFTRLTATSKITGKGQRYFVDKFLAGKCG